MSSGMVGGSIAVWLGVLFCLGLAAAAPGHLPRLKVSANARYLVTQEGKPFFWLGDTAWYVGRLTPEEVDLYLATRKQQGFTVIQISPGSAGNYAGLETTPGEVGRRPFLNDDTDTPDESYWRRIDAFVDKAGRQGLYVVIFPQWGSQLAAAVGGDGAKLRRLGLWVGRRYADRSNVVWSVCGEYDAINAYRPPITEAEKAAIEALARGLR